MYAYLVQISEKRNVDSCVTKSHKIQLKRFILTNLF